MNGLRNIHSLIPYSSGLYQPSIDKADPAPSGESFILLESDDFLLQEDGVSLIKTEEST